MLDQNTDRMWYVIGAVIIGAAIILILNNTFPQLFASIGDTFTEKTEHTTEVVDGIYPVSNPNLLLGTSDEWERQVGRFWSAGSHGQPSMYRALADMGLEVGDTVTLSGDYRFGVGKYRPRLNFSPYTYDSDDEHEKSRTGNTYTGEGFFEFTTTIPEGSLYVRVMINNGQGYVEATQEDYIWLKALKLEKGSTATPWNADVIK